MRKCPKTSSRVAPSGRLHPLTSPLLNSPPEGDNDGHILCLEDEPDMRHDIVEELQVAGYAPIEAANGEEALLAIRTQKPDLVLCDAELQENPLRALTEREHEVLAKLLDGLPNKGIGRDLSIKEVTVKLHLRNVFRKLGAKNRAQAVKPALDWGWVG